MRADINFQRAEEDLAYEAQPMEDLAWTTCEKTCEKPKLGKKS